MHKALQYERGQIRKLYNSFMIFHRLNLNSSKHIEYFVTLKKMIILKNN